MQTVVCDNAAKAVAGYVSYMKRFGFNQNQIINSKNAMLNFLRRYISKELENKRNLEPEWKTCYWRDGYTPMTWYFTLYLLPQQKIVAIMAFTCKENKPEVKEERNTVRLTESELKEIIAESVKTVLTEHYNLEKYGNWNVVEGTKLPQIAKGLEDFGELSDERLYDDGNHNGYMIFKICDGMGKNQGICAKLMFDNGDSWYKALKKDEIPQDILQDLHTKRFS